MKDNMLDRIENLLTKKYQTEGKEFLKNKLISDIIENDTTLLKVLLNDQEIKQEFFIEIDDVTLFDKQKFLWVINSKEFLPDSYTKFSNKIGLSSNEGFLSQNDNIVLSFPYKDCYLVGGQNKDDQKRSEIFFNDILAKQQVSNMLSHKVLANAKRYTSQGVEDNIKLENNDNLIIKGNNLIALSSILRRYEGKIKLIYIDPPYNTGNDSFNYNDSFNRSTWLTFMKNRLEISNQLMKTNSFILVHCDDNEQAYLKVLMDEIFGEENFINSIAILSSTPSGVKTAHREKTIVKTKDFILVYKKGMPRINPQYQEVLKWDTHFNLFFDRKNNEVLSLKEVIVKNNIYDTKVSMNQYDLLNPVFSEFIYENQNNIFQTGKSMPEDIRKISLKAENKNKPIKYGTEEDEQYAYNGRRMSFLSNSINPIITEQGIENRISKLICDFWDDIDFNNSQNEGGVSFPSGKKPEMLLYRILEMFTEENDIVLDYFLGAGTTTAVAHKMNRQYIGIEQMDYIENLTVKRMKNVLEGDTRGISKSVKWTNGGSFVYCELLENNQRIIDQIILSNNNNINKIKNDVFNDPNIVPYITKDELTKVDQDFNGLTLEEKKKALISIIDKNKLYVNYSDINDKEYNISNIDKKFSDSFYRGDSDE